MAGRTGRPILAEDVLSGIQAWTGSHRIAAALEAGLEEIPVVVMSASDIETAGESIDWYAEHVRDDEDRLAWLLEAIGYVPALHVAHSLMQEEIDANA
jgi:ParB-like chromosome segregation protein Spo0J